MKKRIFALASCLAFPFALAGSARAQCEGELSEARHGAAAATVAGTALVAGGWHGTGGHHTSQTVDLYDSASGAWTSAQLSAPRAYLAAASVGGRALFAGGARWSQTFQYIPSDAVDLYDSASGTWSTAALSQARYGLGGVAVGGEALFAGGFVYGGATPVATDVVDIYDAASGTWSQAALASARGNVAATAVGSLALFAGGWDGAQAFDVVDIYDAATGLWSTAQLSVARASLAAASAGGRAYFAGGATGTAYSDVVDIYDAASGTWSTASLSAPRGHLAAGAAGGRVYFAGGSIGTLESSSLVDVLDLATGLWSVTHLVQPRSFIAATETGREFLLAGGMHLMGSSVTEQSIAVTFFSVGHPRSYCHGDGSAAPCPCGNSGGPGRGCANSAGAGALLSGAGCNRVRQEDLVFDAQGLAPGEPALLFAAANTVNGGQGAPFGDGLRCAGGAAVRLGIRTAGPAGDAAWGPGLGALAGWQPGDLRRLQVYYRDQHSLCGSGFNFSNALELTIAP